MKQTVYRIVMSDGTKTDIRASSSADAIGEAIWKHRGLTVIKCYSGMTERDVKIAKQIDHTSTAMVGVINFEIPPHTEIELSQIRPRIERATDLTVAMFPEDLVLSESARALGRKRDDPL